MNEWVNEWEEINKNTEKVIKKKKEIKKSNFEKCSNQQ